jgi:hypothetical protein
MRCSALWCRRFRIPRYVAAPTALYLGSGVDGELELGLLPVVDGEALHEEGGEAGTGSAAKGVEDEEALQAGALLRLLPRHQEENSLAMLELLQVCKKHEIGDIWTLKNSRVAT